MIKTRVLRGSSNKGNCTLIWNDDTAILIDIGIGPRVLRNLLEAQRLSISDLNAALVTHQDGDHVKLATVRDLTAEKVPIYSLPGVKRALLAKDGGHVCKKLKTFSLKQFKISHFDIKPFRVRHDSPGGCAGFSIIVQHNKRKCKITLATDFGWFGNRIINHFRNSDVILVTSDHDTKMLEEDYNIPEDIKEDHIIPYHLSNDQCAELLKKVIKSSINKPKAVLLLHISESINTRAKAVARCKYVLRKAGCKGTRVFPSYGHKPGRKIYIP